MRRTKRLEEQYRSLEQRVEELERDLKQEIVEELSEIVEDMVKTKISYTVIKRDKEQIAMEAKAKILNKVKEVLDETTK